MLRVHAAAHGLAIVHHAVTEVGADEITVRIDSTWLRFTDDLLESHDGCKSGFRLNDDGTVTLDGVYEEMDMTAERITREVMK